MNKYFFTEDEINSLIESRDKQKDYRLKLRSIALIALADGNNSIEIVASTFGCSARTIDNWFRTFKTKGIEYLNEYHYKPKQSYLNDLQINQVEIFVTFENPKNVKVVVEYIKEKFDVDYSEEAVRLLLKKRGLCFIRQKTVPGSTPSVQTQKDFIKQYEMLKNDALVKSRKMKIGQ